jgi:hypothetical protein
MRSEKDKNKGFYSFRADANALGGFLEESFRKPLPTLAPVSLPAVGGFAKARSEAFTHDDIVSCSSAYTRVSGQENDDKSISILVSAVVEGLNLLDVVEADRVVAKLSILIPPDRGPLKVSTAGSRFEGLRLQGRRREPQLNQQLQDWEKEVDAQGRAHGATVEDLWTIGKTQAKTVTEACKDDNAKWVKKRFKWMKQDAVSNASALCSLVDGFESAKPAHCGHFVDIPDYGRFFFGELLLTPDSAQLVSIRADLGCAVKGKITINCAGGGGVGNL